MPTTKIAVLGGGCGSMSAVWALTQLPDWQERFDITVYQLGWRLGGKCASGRDPANSWRIYEHGLHVWGGFYENAFHLMEDVYSALPPDARDPISQPPRGPGKPRPAWDNALKPQCDFILQEYINGQYLNWQITMPQNGDVPGTGGAMPSLWDYFMLLVNEIRARISHHAPTPESEPFKAFTTRILTENAVSNDSIFTTFSSTFDTVVRDGVRDVVRDVVGDDRDQPPSKPRPALDRFNVMDILDAAQLLVRSLPSDPARQSAVRLDDLVFIIEEASRIFLQPAAVAGSNFWRRAEFVLNFALAVIRGMVRDGVLLHGWHVINHLEWKTWLGNHGAKQATLDSALVRGIYDYVFGFVKGQPGNPQIEAGTAMNGVLRLFFTFKGAIFWEMQAGMGDVVFSPLYRVLKDRGVKFEFFSKVTNLVVKNGKVDSIKMLRQATIVNGAAYDPLVNVGGVQAWPSQPDYAQLVEGAELQAKNIDLESHWTTWTGKPFTLTCGGSNPDFHQVLLGISIGALGEIAGEVAIANPAFKTMIDQIKTVQTQSMQLWLDGDANRLGAPNTPRCATAAPEPIATWCDMSHLLAREEWPRANPPVYLAYFCGELADEVNNEGNDFPAFMLQQFRDLAVWWLQNYTGLIWARATSPRSNALDWSLLHDPQNRVGEARLDAQFLRVNINPSDRYVASFPGTSQYRLSADAPVLPNLFIAGDWVQTSLNAGCVEAAMMGGLYAARAISGNSIRIIGG